MPAEIIPFPTPKPSKPNAPCAVRQLHCEVGKCKVYKGIDAEILEINLLIKTDAVPIGDRENLVDLLTSRAVIFATLAETAD